MPFDTIRPYDSFVKGQQNAMQREYTGSRNALAQMEVEQAPRDIANRNALAERQQQQYSQEQVQLALQQTAAGAMRIAQSENPQAEAAQAYPEFAAKLREQNPDWDRLPPEEARQYAGWIAGQAQSKLGIAPAPKVKTFGDTADPGAGILQEDPTTGVLKQVVAPQRPDNFVTGQANADRRAQEQRDFTAEQNRLNRESQEKRTQVTASKPPKVTEGERVSANYLLRMEESEPLVAGFTPTTRDAVAFSRVLNSDSEVMSSVANKFLSPAAQKYYQASSDWVRAKLRKESGAAIPPAEMIQEIKTYFPMPNDSKEVVEQKRQARITAAQGMRSMAGGAPQANAQQPKQQPATNANGWALMTDANGNRAYVSPDGAQFEEVR